MTAANAVKICVVCGISFTRKRRETPSRWEKRVGCCASCSQRARPKKAKLVGRYRNVTINGRTLGEHRWVMEQHLGRELESWEHVHHKNHDKLDNRIENLELVTPAEHGIRHTWRPISRNCVTCGAEFTPHKTKRARQQACSPACRLELLSRRASERPSAGKVTATQVIEIRAAVNAGEAYQVIAARYGVSRTAISSIATRKTWRRVPDVASALVEAITGVELERQL